MFAWLALCDLAASGCGELWFPHSAVLLSHISCISILRWCFAPFCLFSCHANPFDNAKPLSLEKSGSTWRKPRRLETTAKQNKEGARPKQKNIHTKSTRFAIDTFFFLVRARCLSAGLRYLRLTRLPRHDRGPVPGGIDPRLAVYARS